MNYRVRRYAADACIAVCVLGAFGLAGLILFLAGDALVSGLFRLFA